MTPSPDSLPTRPQSPRVLPSGCQDICSRLPGVQLVLFCRLSRVRLLRRIRRRELASGSRGCCSISRMSGSCTVLLISTIFELAGVCVCVFFPFILDIKFVGRTSRGHTGGRSHRISHPPSFCGACLNFSSEKDSAIAFPRRP